MNRIIISFLLLSVFLRVESQSLQGTVVDEAYNPIAYATVSLLQSEDSTVVGGTVTDDNGHFVIEMSGGGQLLRVSYVGYATQLCEATDGQTIIMPSTELTVNGVVVKGHRPVYRLEGNAFVAPIQGTVLSNLGDGMDVLRQLPLVSGDDKELNVVGQRGSILVYINKRKMKDWEELRQLPANMIREVRIETTPGPQYDATVGTVIHVVTLRPQGEGIGGRVLAEVSQGKDFESRSMVNLNYRHAAIDVFGGIYLNNPANQGEHEETYRFVSQQDEYNALSQGQERNKYNWLWMNAGFNHQPNERQYLSMQYTYDTYLKYKMHTSLDNTFAGGGEQSVFQSVADRDRQRGRHQLATYYSQALSPTWNLVADGAWVHILTDETDDETENRLGTWDSFVNQSKFKSDVLALKAILSVKLGKGLLDWGAEGIYTRSSQDYQVLKQQTGTPIPDNSSESRQQLGSLFASYQRTLGKLAGSIGLRCEIADYQYYKDGVRLADDSRVYRHLFPNVALSYKGTGWSTSFGYRVTVLRPNYSALQTGVKFGNSYLYYEGNPLLKPEYNHHYSLTAACGDLQLIIGYNHCVDQCIKTLTMYGDLPIMLENNRNIDVNYLSGSLSWSPTIGCWKPSLTASLAKQYMEYMDRQYNHPMFSYMWKNVLSLAGNWQVVFNVDGHTRGDGEAYTAKSALVHNMSLYATKRMGGWTLLLGINDPLHTFKDDGYEWHGSIYHRHWTDLEARSVYVRLTYHFNPVQSKYKSGTAGQSEIKRL